MYEKNSQRIKGALPERSIKKRPFGFAKSKTELIYVLFIII